MAYSYKTIYTVVSDGVTKVFTIPYGFLRASFIEVWINDTTKLTYLTDYHVNTAGEVELVSAVAAGSTIAIKRNTSKSPLVSWSDASVLLSKDLSLQDTQLLHIQEELSDAVQNDATEAAARATQAAADALAYKNAAKTSEDNAKLSETAADLSELNAKTSEDNAKTSEDNAKASEVAAKASETAAANSAVGAAASQVASANSSLAASNSETNALASKVAAKTSEDNAKASEIAAAGSASGAATSATTATEAAATAVANGGTLALPNHIVKGGKVSATNGLVMTHGFLEAIIKRRIIYKTAGDTQTLPAKRMGLLTIDKDGNRGTVLATDPTTFIDNNTIGLWKPDGSTSCPNLAVGVNGNTLAVANNLTKTGTVMAVDGIFGGNAGQGDGSTGQYGAANSTGIPTGANPFEYSVYVPAFQSVTGNSRLKTHGLYTANGCFNLITIGSRVNFNNYSANYDTGFDVEIGKSYWFVVAYDGTNAKLYVNGIPVYSLTITLAITSANFVLLGGAAASVQFIEERNACRTAQQITEQAAKMLFPICYDKASASYPTISTTDKATAYHEYKFDETSGEAVADSAGTLNGTATGTTIVDSELGLGKARKFSGVSGDYLSLGNYAFPSEYTVLIGGNIKYTGGFQGLLSNFSGTNGQGNLFMTTADGTLQIGNSEPMSSTAVGSKSKINFGTNTLFGFTFKNNTVSFVVNNIIEDAISYLQGAGSHPLYVGKRYDNNTCYLFGTMDYLLIIPRALSQAEVAQYYNALMSTGRKNITSTLPADTISLGMVRTSATGVLAYDDSTWQWGRREGAYGGNRVAIQDYKPVVEQTPASMKWTSPFGSGATYNVEWRSAEDTNGKNDYACLPYSTSGSNYGVQSSFYTNGKIGVYVGNGGSTVTNDARRTGGYIRPIFTLQEVD